MVLTQRDGLQTKDEQQQPQQQQGSEKSDLASSIKSHENSARIEDILDWINGMPLSKLSKTTKNLARDFSDGVLFAEILKFYYPNMVASHNYIASNSQQSKRDNWNTLNRKVLSKIDMRISPEIIDELIRSTPGVIEKVLIEFRDKQMSLSVPESEQNNDTEPEEIEEKDVREILIEVKPKEEKEPINQTGFFEAVTNFFAALFGMIIAILCFWRWFSKSPKRHMMTFENHEEQLRRAEEEHRLRESYSQAVNELRVKGDVIKTLCHKVAFLEGTMKLKDMKIAALNSQLDQNHPNHPNKQESIGQMASARLNQTQTAVSKLRRRTRPQI